MCSTIYTVSHPADNRVCLWARPNDSTNAARMFSNVTVEQGIYCYFVMSHMVNKILVGSVILYALKIYARAGDCDRVIQHTFKHLTLIG